MTRKLYYEDVYKMEFFSQVVKTGEDERGPYVVLEATAFYPEGGGQPHDEGTIADIPVNDVQEVDGEVRHYITGVIPDQQQVRGAVNEERRLDHMQQHSGQHILSAVFDDQFDMKTTSFHLGSETVTIDLDAEELSEEVLAQAEKRVNEIIRMNHPVETKWMSASEAGNYPLRKSLAVEEEARLVIIPGVDYNGCGGTHPQTTGEVMAAKLLGWTKNKKQVRVEFACGHRVLKKLGEKHRVVTDLKRIVPKPEHQLVGEIEEWMRAGKEKDKKIAGLEEQLLGYEAQEILSRANGKQVIQHVFQNRAIKALQTLGKAIISESPDSYMILVSEQEDQLQFVLACGEAVERNMNEVAKQAMVLIDGKGGGKPNFVQGGGKRTLAGEDFAAHIRNLL